MQAQTQQLTIGSGIRIYVADLAAYNAGYLHGVWLEAAQEVEAMREQVAAMLACSPVTGAEEYAIHDFEGFGSYRVSEHQDLESVREVACFIERFPDFGAELVEQFGNVAQAREAAEENYAGSYPSLADYAQELTEEAEPIRASLSYYIDYERMARDMELNGELFTIKGASRDVHIFWNR